MSRQNFLRYQKGLATLTVTLILLFIATLVALYTANTSIKEQQISANQYRAEQSLSTANGALDWGAAYYAETRGSVCDERLVGKIDDYACPPADGSPVVCTIYSEKPGECQFTFTETEPLYIDPNLDADDPPAGPDDALSIGHSEMYFAFIDGAGNELDYIPVSVGPGEYDLYGAQLRVYGIGHSDDDTGRRTVSIDVHTFNIFGDEGPGNLNYPLISKSVDEFRGSLTVINRFANNTIWAGTEQDVSGSTNTYISDPALDCKKIENHDECVGTSGNPHPDNTLRATEGKDDVDSDVVDSDSNLHNLSGEDEFFINFFGMSKDDMKALIREAGGLFPNTKSWSDLVGETLIWIDGDYSPAGGAQGVTVGTQKDPVVMIVDGDFKPGGNINIIGILYVTGAWDPGANNNVQGVAIVETGTVGSGQGGATLVYDNNLLEGAQGAPPGTVAASVPGTWKDWE